MRKILQPVLPGQARFQIEKHISGGLVFRFGDDGVLLAPRQAYDVARGILNNLGIEVNEITRREGDFNGDPLMARIKLIG